MAQDLRQINDIMSNINSISSDDPELIKKLNEIALKLAKIQHKKPLIKNLDSSELVDPMEELGCEGCQ